MRNTTDVLLISPANDPESVLILRIAKALGIPSLRSSQRHGGSLDLEPNLFSRIKEANSWAKTLVIIELPGLASEKTLEEQGFDVIIIDHHRYESLDRMREESSIEQFIAYFEITDAELVKKDISPVLVRGVGAIDRGFLWELSEAGFSEEEKKMIVKEYQTLQRGLDPARRTKEEGIAKEIWARRRLVEGFLVLESDEDRVSIRDPLSYLVFDAYPKHPPQTIIVQGKRRIYVQEIKKAKVLFDHFGGFTFGRDLCWGYLSEEGKAPTLDEVLSVIVK